MNWQDLLGKTKVFKDLSPQEISVVEELSKERSYKAGTRILKEAQPAEEFFVCIEGELTVQIELAGRGDITTRTISKGGVFGWSALADTAHYSASVVAKNDCRVLAFSGTGLKEVFENHPRIGYLTVRNLLGIVYSRLQDMRFGLASCIVDSHKR